MDPQTLLTDNLPHVRAITRALGRRYGFRDAVQEDFESWVLERLVEDDYRVLSSFQGRSKLTTYLTVVISHLARDFRFKQKGRWRPSAAAKRLGPIAMRLDTLLHRDGLSRDEAAAIVRSEFPEAPPDRELHRTMTQLPGRNRRAVLVGTAEAPDLTSPNRADEGLRRSEQERHAARVYGVLERCMADLPEEDQVILRLRFEQGMTTADVSRALGLEQKPLYRRVERLLSNLGVALRQEGLGKSDVAEILADHAATGEPAPGIDWGEAGAEAVSTSCESSRSEA